MWPAIAGRCPMESRSPRCSEQRDSSADPQLPLVAFPAVPAVRDTRCFPLFSPYLCPGQQGAPHASLGEPGLLQPRITAVNKTCQREPAAAVPSLSLLFHTPLPGGFSCSAHSMFARGIHTPGRAAGLPGVPTLPPLPPPTPMANVIAGPPKARAGLTLPLGWRGAGWVCPEGC